MFAMDDGSEWQSLKSRGSMRLGPSSGSWRQDCRHGLLLQLTAKSASAEPLRRMSGTPCSNMPRRTSFLSRARTVFRRESLHFASHSYIEFLPSMAAHSYGG